MITLVPNKPYAPPSTTGGFNKPPSTNIPQPAQQLQNNHHSNGKEALSPKSSMSGWCHDDDDDDVDELHVSVSAPGLQHPAQVWLPPRLCGQHEPGHTEAEGEHGGDEDDRPEQWPWPEAADPDPEAVWPGIPPGNQWQQQ